MLAIIPGNSVALKCLGTIDAIQLGENYVQNSSR
jgi:hypothetical protein